MTNTNIKINSKAKILEEYNIQDGTELSESEAYKIAREINTSKKGKAIVENNELKVKDLIVG